MANSKLGYYADFVVYAGILLALPCFTLPGTQRGDLLWLRAALIAAAGWTLAEYLLHRFAFHRLPKVVELHHAHHKSPRSYLATPTWLTLTVFGSVIFVPLWRGFSLTVAGGAFSGFIAGWLWYGIVHHVIHHQKPVWLATTLSAASRRHGQHHALSSCNFGVTTSFWDQLFGTFAASGNLVQRRRVPSVTTLESDNSVT
jgi:sterol desaturase/sphingolipid hydroxylase (fatty acid hydroxylase superfamily)